MLFIKRPHLKYWEAKGKGGIKFSLKHGIIPSFPHRLDVAKDPKYEKDFGKKNLLKILKMSVHFVEN